MIWKSWKLSHVLQPSWLLLKFHAFVVEKSELREKGIFFIFKSLILNAYNMFSISHYVKSTFFFFFPPALFLQGETWRGFLWDYWPWLIGYLGLCWVPFVFYSDQMQTLEFNGSRKVKGWEDRRPQRMWEQNLGGGIRLEVMSEKTRDTGRSFFFICVLTQRVWV